MEEKKNEWVVKKKNDMKVTEKYENWVWRQMEEDWDPRRKD